MGCSACKAVSVSPTDPSLRKGSSSKNFDTTGTSVDTASKPANSVPLFRREGPSPTALTDDNTQAAIAASAVSLTNSTSTKKHHSSQQKPIPPASSGPSERNAESSQARHAGDHPSTVRPTSPVSTDTSSMAHKVVGSPKVASGEVTPTLPGTKLPEKDQRNLSTCRLKRAADITDSYDISSEVLGTGISGAVRVANHKVTNRRYAIKTLSLQGVSPKKAAMLHNEVAIYLQLDHPNIAKLIEVYETNEAIHLVMELCTGGELYHRLATRKKYSERDAASVAQQMLSAINYCHKHHICHRDLKLENWVYADNSADAPIKLIDFGFSRIFNPGIPMTAMHGTVYYVSPEVMDGCYQEKCDIWSIGVIVYMLLSGSPPFNGTYDHEILVRIKRGAFSFSGPRWEGISDGAKSFIRFLLQKDPDVRPSAEEALAHPWLQRRDVSDEYIIDLAVLKSMRDFALCNILRRAALNVVALSMTSQEVEELEAAFRKLDRNSQGTIPLQDLVNLLIEYLHIDPVEAERIFNRIDQTGNREVHYTEFIASTLQARFVKDESLIQEAFQRFDVDHQNRITLNNLRSVLGDTYNGTRVEDIMALCDTNGDGMIDFEEFRKALTSDEAVLSNSINTNGPNDATPLTSDAKEDPAVKREAALSALHSMRKATCLNADVERSHDVKSQECFYPKGRSHSAYPSSLVRRLEDLEGG